MNTGNCENCQYLVRSSLPPIGFCTLPERPAWQSERRYVTIAAVRECQSWQPKAAEEQQP